MWHWHANKDKGQHSENKCLYKSDENLQKQERQRQKVRPQKTDYYKEDFPGKDITK